MQLKLTARHDHPSDAARQYAETKLAKLDRRLHDLTLVEVTFSREHNPSIANDHTVEAVVHTKGPNLVAARVGARRTRPRSIGCSTSSSVRSSATATSGRSRAPAGRSRATPPVPELPIEPPRDESAA